MRRLLLADRVKTAADSFLTPLLPALRTQFEVRFIAEPPGEALAEAPLGGPAQHAKYARNEVYSIVRRFGPKIGHENTTVTPIPGDVCYFDFAGGVKAAVQSL
ncbi:MAG: DUF3830 family protein, partial [Rhodospirillales bacterium]|nr:DUF3830 family protein [Rhodospirillales bacterium]